MFLGTPLSDSAYSAVTTGFYTRSRLAAGIELSSVPPASTQSSDSSSSSDARRAETQPQQRPQARTASKAHAHATVDRVSISSMARASTARAAQPPVQSAEPPQSSVQSVDSINTSQAQKSAPNDTDSDRAQELAEPAYTATEVAEQGESTGAAAQESRAQTVQSDSFALQAASSTNSSSVQSAGKLDTYA